MRGIPELSRIGCFSRTKKINHNADVRHRKKSDSGIAKMVCSLATLIFRYDSFDSRRWNDLVCRVNFEPSSCSVARLKSLMGTPQKTGPLAQLRSTDTMCFPESAQDAALEVGRCLLFFCPSTQPKAMLPTLGTLLRTAKPQASLVTSDVFPSAGHHRVVRILEPSPTSLAVGINITPDLQLQDWKMQLGVPPVLLADVVMHGGTLVISTLGFQKRF